MQYFIENLLKAHKAMIEILTLQVLFSQDTAVEYLFNCFPALSESILFFCCLTAIDLRQFWTAFVTGLWYNPPDAWSQHSGTLETESELVP